MEVSIFNSMGPLKDTLAGEREKKNLTKERVSVATGIPMRFLDYLESGEYRKLPPDAYVFGYLAKLARVYGMEAVPLWDLYKTEKGEPIRSGISDRFPGSATMQEQKAPSGGIGVALASVVALAAFSYVGWQVHVFVRPPQVTIASPVIDVSTDNPEFTISGFVQKYTTLAINDEPVLTNTDGSFSKVVMLQEGVNAFVFKVRTVLGKESLTTRRVIYAPIKPPEPPESPEGASPTEPPTTSANF
jgi:transcriptional regulator with XRE-family HTH domain